MHSPEQIALARQMYIDGEPVARIRKVCEMSEGTLYYWLDGGPADGDLHLEPLPRRSTGKTCGDEKTPGPRRRRLSGDWVPLVGRLWRTRFAPPDLCSRLESSSE